MKYAVEAKTAQVKKRGFPSNLYIVQGEAFAFCTSSKSNPNAVKCDITTRIHASKNRIGYLAKTDIPSAGLNPRPNHIHQWEKDENGEWCRG